MMADQQFDDSSVVCELDPFGYEASEGSQP